MADDTPPEAGQEEKQQNTWLWVVIGIVGGCGCLIVVLFALGLGSAFYAILGATREDDVANPPILEDQPAEDEGNIESGEALQGPGEQAALVYALSEYGDQYPSVKVRAHSDDWTNVSVLMGPSEGQWEFGAFLVWDEQIGEYYISSYGEYDAETDEIQEVEDVGSPGDTGEVPEIYQPGPELAKEAALMDTPDWVARIVSHSPDYHRVVVWIGPPQSEWVSEIALEWDSSITAYQVVEAGEVPVDYGD